MSECDGRCASGKTALATELATAVAIWNPAIQILRPSVDRFHNARERRNRQGEYSPSGYYEAAYDYQALADYLLSKRVRINWTFRPEKYMITVMADGSELAVKYALLNPYLSERQMCREGGGELDQIQFLLGHVSVQTTERYLGCKQRLRNAVNDRIGIEPDA